MKLVPFAFENVPVRVADQNGEPWFVAKDAVSALGKTWDGHSLDTIPDAWKGVVKLTTPGGDQELVTINEAAVYKLAFRSNKPQADRFTNWVAGDVLPTIRKTGGYGLPADDAEREFGMVKSLVRDLKKARDEAAEYCAELRRGVEDLREQNLLAARRPAGFSSSRDYKLAITVADEQRIPVEGRGRLVHSMKAALIRFTAERNFPQPREEQRDDGRKPRPMFHVDAIAAWLVAEGYAMIAAHLAKRPFARQQNSAQNVFSFDQKRKAGKA